MLNTLIKSNSYEIKSIDLISSGKIKIELIAKVVMTMLIAD